MYRPIWIKEFKSSVKLLQSNLWFLHDNINNYTVVLLINAIICFYEYSKGYI